MIVVGKIDSLKFSVFLKLLGLLLKNICQDGDLPIVVLDNARTHSFRFTKKVIKDSHFQTRFSAPYWPKLVSVEQAFWMIKSKLRSLGGVSKINFERPNGFEKIFQLLESIQDTSWIQAWARVIKEAKMTILKKLVAQARQEDDANVLESRLDSTCKSLWGQGGPER